MYTKGKMIYSTVNFKDNKKSCPMKAAFTSIGYKGFRYSS